LRQQIKTLEKTIHTCLHHTPAYEQLLTVQGIGTILAQTITLATGAISRFPREATLPRIAAVWTVPKSAMASATGRAMSKMAIHIWLRSGSPLGGGGRLGEKVDNLHPF
jgi:hypothetical protein